MNLLTSLLIAIGGKVAADEIRDCASWLPPKMIRWAARRLDEEMSERYEEEWLSHGKDLPGSIPKMLHALGCVYAALSIHDGLRRRALTACIRPMLEILGPFTALALLPELLQERRWEDLSPDQIRIRRLNVKSSIIFTLGLNQLAIEPSDLSLIFPYSKSRFDAVVSSFIAARFPLFNEIVSQHIYKCLFKYLLIGHILVDRISRLGFTHANANDLFTTMERATVAQQVAELKQYVINNGSLMARNSSLLERTMKYLTEASRQRGRKGFFKSVLFVLRGIASYEMLARDQRTEFIVHGVNLFESSLPSAFLN